MKLTKFQMIKNLKLVHINTTVFKKTFKRLKLIIKNYFFYLKLITRAYFGAPFLTKVKFTVRLGNVFSRKARCRKFLGAGGYRIHFTKLIKHEFLRTFIKCS